MSTNIDGKILPRAFYARPTISVALDLLGKSVYHSVPRGLIAGKIVEVEAYLGERDPACHAFYGKTNRTGIFWGDPGIAYIFISYGIHYCLNTITEESNTAGCVLIRALEPTAGTSLMEKNRGVADLYSLADGPGKLTQALGITVAQNGVDLTKGNFLILSEDCSDCPDIVVTSRIGISKAEKEPLRFYIGGNRFVSRQNSAVEFFRDTATAIKEVFDDEAIDMSLRYH